MTKTTVTMRRIGWVAVGALAAALFGGVAAGGCSSSDNSAGAMGAGGATGAAGAAGTAGGAGAGGSETLYAKYGGAATVAKVVDDAVAGVLADCELTPYFAVVGQTGHDSADRLKSCLRLQFTVLMGGPGTYPGTNDRGETCADMQAVHAGLGIPGGVFDKFMSDLAMVLATDGVSAADIATMAGALGGIKTQVVSPAPVEKTACTANAGAGG